MDHITDGIYIHKRVEEILKGNTKPYRYGTGAISIDRDEIPADYKVVEVNFEIVEQKLIEQTASING